MMSLNLQSVWEACNPGRILVSDAEIESDRQPPNLYYVNFADFRSSLVKRFRRTIALSSTKPTCQLMTGTAGSGKTTELIQLRVELEQQGFWVIYLDADQDLDLTDLSTIDLLLAIASRIQISLENSGIRLQTHHLINLVDELLSGFEVSSLPNSTASARLTQLLITCKSNFQLRQQVRQSLEPQLKSIFWSINTELLSKALEELKKCGKKGLVVLVDNLEKLSDRVQHQQLFTDKAESLQQLHCHKVYTFPLWLVFSGALEALQTKFNFSKLDILTMIAVRSPLGEENLEAIDLCKQVILTRAFPQTESQSLMQLVSELFEQPDSLDYLCRVSGGNLRQLLRLFYGCLQYQDPPISATTVNEIIQIEQNNYISAVTEPEWQLLHQVIQQQAIANTPEQKALLQKMFLFAYQQAGNIWFDINPLIAFANL